MLLIQGLGYTADLWFRVLPGLSEPAPHDPVRQPRASGAAACRRRRGSIEEMADDAVTRPGRRRGRARRTSSASRWAALIAQELALRYPDRVRCARARLHPSRAAGDAVRMDPAAATMLMDRTPKSAREAIEASVPFLYAETTSRDDIDGDLAARLRYALRATAYWGQLDAMRQHDGTLSRLPQVTAPTLGDARHGRPAGAARQRRADRGGDPRRAAGVAGRRRPPVLDRSDRARRSSSVNDFLRQVD